MDTPISSEQQNDIVSPSDTLPWKTLVAQHDERLTAPLKAEIARLVAENQTLRSYGVDAAKP